MKRLLMLICVLSSLSLFAQNRMLVLRHGEGINNIRINEVDSIIFINSDQSGTKEDPFVISELISLANIVGVRDSMRIYVKGIVTSIQEVDFKKGYATFYISDFKDKNSSVLINRSSYLSGNPFVSNEQIKTNDEVVVCGMYNYINHENLYVDNCYLYSVNGQTFEDEYKKEQTIVIDSLHSLLFEYANDIDSLNYEIDSIRHEYTYNVDSLQNNIDSLINNIESLHTEKDSLRNTIDSIRHEYANNIDSLQSIIDSLLNSVTITQTKAIKVENGNKVTICVPSANRKLIVTIGPSSKDIGNGLIDFRYWGYSSLSSGIEGTRTKLYSTESDCFGPFQIRAKSNIDGDDLANTTFTGGSHRYNNKSVGSSPTARLGNVDIRVDGLSSESYEGEFTEFEIQWDAYVQATNTKKEDGTGREVLKQVNTIKYADGEFRCSTELIPLEDITLHLWYGYQCVGVNPGGTYSLTDHWVFVNAENRVNDSTGSGAKDTSAMIGYTDKFEQQMWVDTTIDMGKREMLTGEQSGAFKSGDKGYFRIANNDATLAEGEHYFLYGIYIFKLKDIAD